MLNDLKIALRRLRHAPGFTAVAVLTLALAIGANTAVLGIADAVLFRPLPYGDADRVFVLEMMDQRTGARYWMVPNAHLEPVERLGEYIEGIGLFEELGALTMQTDDGAESVPLAGVTPDYFELLEVQPALGRSFTGEDLLGGGRPALLSWEAFQRRFDGDETVVGSAVTIGTTTFDVIGVLPRDFVVPSFFATSTEVITVMRPPAAGASGGTANPIVRLREAVTVEQVDVAIAAANAELATAQTENPTVPALTEVRAVLYPTGRPIMRLLLAASLMVLLLGCANLANMLLARARLREREIGVQAALGAGRTGLLRPLLFEALVLGTTGAVAALVITRLSFGYLLRQVPPAALGQAPVGVDGRVTSFAFVLGVIASLAFAAVPAWRASRLDAQALLRGTIFGSDKRGAFGRPMLAAQVGLAVVLVFGALVAARAFVSVLRVPLGFDPDNVITVSISPRVDDGVARQAFYRRAIEELRRRPDVISAGAAGAVPLDRGAADEGTVSPDGRELATSIYHVLPGYFETIGIELVAGRLPTRADVDTGADVAVVAPSAARELFPGRDPIGATFRNNVGRRLTVVGVVAEVTQSLARENRPAAYALPYDATRRMTLVIKARSRNDATLTEIRRQVSGMAPGVPIDAQWWNDQVSAATAYRNPRFQTLVLGSFATLALGLTALGVFGLVAFLVAARMRELGIRLAIGAAPGRLVLHALSHMLAPTALGLLAGLLATRLLADLAAAQLYDVETSDPLTLAAAFASVAVAAVIAAWLPARRAARVDPMTVLREQ